MRFRLALGLAPLLFAQTASAQQIDAAASSRVYAQRDELVALADFYDRAAESPAYGEVLRQRATDRAHELRRRLEEGDFQVGDRILLYVEGEPTLSDSFTVARGQVLDLPELGQVPLRGVLRADLGGHLRAELGRYLQGPRVTARSLIRISITGAVVRPGFYTVASETVLADVLMEAGGPIPTARLDGISVNRADQAILEGRALQEAMAAGRTLDQIGMVAGDRFVVPERGTGLAGAEGPIRALGYILALPLTIYTLTQLF